MRARVWAAVLALGAVNALAQDTGREQDLGANLFGVNLEQITLLVQKKTGYKFLWTEELGLNKKKVYFKSDKPIEKKEDVFRIYQAFLQVNDMILVPVRGTSDTDIVYKIQQLQYGPKRPTPFVTDAKDPADRFVTRVFSLKYVVPSAVHQAVINMVTLPQGVFPIDSAGILLITDYDYNIQRFEKIIEQIDQPKPDIVLRRIELKYALASDVETMMNALAQTILSRATAGGMRGGMPIQPGMPGSTGEQVKIAADKRTNSVIVLADLTRIDQIEKIIRELDTETGFETSGIYIYHLRHTNAVDVSKTLNAMYKISVDDKGQPSGGSGARPGQPVAPSPTGGGAGGLGTTTATTSGGTLGTEPTIVADSRANSILVITDRNTYKSIEQIIRKLDSRRPQVLIKATVVEVKTTDSFDFGAELAKIKVPSNSLEGVGLTSFGLTTPVFDTTNNNFSLTPVATTGITLALLKDKLGNIAGILKAAEGKAKVSILDEPEACTVDNGLAEMSVKNKVPVKKVTVNQGVSTTSFEFEEAATVLSISPHISEGAYLRLETSIKIEKFVQESTNVDVPPSKSSREIKTNIMIPNARTVVIGGIVTQDSSDTVSGVPILSHIPILGLLFKRTQKSETKRTLYIFITPYILYDESFGDFKELTEERKADIERIRGEMLKKLQVDGPPELAPRSTFRFSRRRQ